MNDIHMIEIDGSQGEGGGQVLRTSLTLSMITGQPVRINRIRANRRTPGLAPQHLAGVLAASQICRAEVSGAKIRSMQLTFSPGGPVQSGSYIFDISQLAQQGSAGAVTLLLQTILLPLALAKGPTRLVLRGGTHVAWSPPVHYVEWVLLPTLARMGLEAQVNLEEYGWYPIGGGSIRVEIAGDAQPRGIDLSERGELVELKGIAAASNLPSHIPQRIANRANNVLREARLPVKTKPVRVGGPSTGTGLFMALVYKNARAGFSALGERGKPSDAVADEAADALVDFHNHDRTLDEHLPDQILPAMALASGPSALTTQAITLHTLTNIAIIQHFIDRATRVEGTQNQPGRIAVL